MLLLGRFIAAFGHEMLLVAIGWELYERTNDALALGLVGLVQVLPVVLLSLYTGHVADRRNPRHIVIIAQLVMGIAGFGLLLLSVTHGSIVLVYGCLLVMGIARAFNDPAASTLFTMTVPPKDFTNATTWSSSSWQLAVVAGPALGGALIAIFKQAAPVYAGTFVACVLFAYLTTRIKGRELARETARASLRTLTSGLGFIWRDKVILAAITLDMFAVLLGGATALLPVFARDILMVGPEGLGLLRAAPSIGALSMAVTLAHRSAFKRAGRTLLLSVIGFGIATIVFGLSKSFILSLLMLATLGALDNISVVIRGSLLLTRTPDHMRGRVSAVNSVFIGLSNELGAFESGVAAAFFGGLFGATAGTIITVAGGGVGTVLVVAAISVIWPEIRRLKRLDDPAPGTTLPSANSADGTTPNRSDSVKPGTVSATGD